MSLDGDGFADMLIGATQADGEEDARINAGEAWIIYGTSEMTQRYGAVTDMRQPSTDATRIIGADYDDLLGACTWGDDLNGDGYDDAIHCQCGTVARIRRCRGIIIWRR